jgi:arsenate reductase
MSAANDKVYNVLFICTGNSARSIIAEGLMNHYGRGQFRAFSAGSHPTGVVNPLALEQLRELRLPIDGFRSKNWDEFARTDSPRLDFVFTVCDKAAGEVCPLWPSRPMTAHWGVADPATVEGPAEVRERAFLDAAAVLKRRIELMLALPLQSLQGLSLQREIERIGKTGAA